MFTTYIFLTYNFKRDFDALYLMLFSSYINGVRQNTGSEFESRQRQECFISCGKGRTKVLRKLIS